MVSEVEIQLLATVMTSSPGPIPSALSEMYMASVPLAQEIQCLVPIKLANCSSNFFTKGPWMNAVWLMTEAMASSISS